MHTVTISLLRSLTRMAVAGVPVHEAARRTGQTRHFIEGWARIHHVKFEPLQSRGIPAWLLPEAARQAEMTLRRTCERLCHYGDPYYPKIVPYH